MHPSIRKIREEQLVTLAKASYLFIVFVTVSVGWVSVIVFHQFPHGTRVVSRALSHQEYRHGIAKQNTAENLAVR